MSPRGRRCIVVWQARRIMHTLRPYTPGRGQDAPSPHRRYIRIKGYVCVPFESSSTLMYSNILTQTWWLSIKSPSLHVWGASDEIITSRRSKSLAADYFGLGADNSSAVFLEHTGGHLVPRDKHIRDGFQDFLHSRRGSILAVEWWYQSRCCVEFTLLKGESSIHEVCIFFSDFLPSFSYFTFNRKPIQSKIYQGDNFSIS